MIAELPFWKCHKEVRAAKITEIRRTESGAIIYLEGTGAVVWVQVDLRWLDKHQPKTGGYYVVYEDGYASFSPPLTFEEGYTRIAAEETA